MSFAQPAAPAQTPLRTRRPTRRNRPLHLDTSVPSPCQSLCQIDKTDGTCLGCGRTLDEIRTWMIMSADEKHAVWDRLRALPDCA